jgi:hypothetical protein
VLADLVLALGVLVVLFVLVLSRMREAWRLTRYADSAPRVAGDSVAGRPRADPMPPDGPDGRRSPASRD